MGLTGARRRGRLGEGSRAGSVVVIGLGNPILTDDAVGLVVLREVRRRLEPGLERLGAAVDFVEASAGGLDLIDLLAGHRAAVLIDAVITRQARPGEVLDLDPAFLEDTTHLGTTGLAHQVDLGTAWKLGKTLGLPLPERLRILAVEAADVKTFGESLSPEVAAALPAVVEAVVAAVTELGRWAAGEGGPA